MASTIVLFDQLDGAQTGGTWSRISASGPSAPVLYDDSIDFAAQPAGAYVYRYSVTDGTVTDTADVTVTWNGDTPARINSTCATSYYINSGLDAPFTITLSDDSSYECGVQAVSTDSEAAPTEWNQGTYSGDLWYMFVAKPKTTAYQIAFTVSGSLYGSGGIYSPAIEVHYHLAAGETCANNVLQTAAASTIGQQTVNASIFIPGDNVFRIVRFRVSSVAGYEGKFDITVEGICP